MGPFSESRSFSSFGSVGTIFLLVRKPSTANVLRWTACRRRCTLTSDSTDTASSIAFMSSGSSRGSVEAPAAGGLRPTETTRTTLSSERQCRKRRDLETAVLSAEMTPPSRSHTHSFPPHASASWKEVARTLRNFSASVMQKCFFPSRRRTRLVSEMSIRMNCSPLPSPPVAWRKAAKETCFCCMARKTMHSTSSECTMRAGSAERMEEPQAERSGPRAPTTFAVASVVAPFMTASSAWTLMAPSSVASHPSSVC
mmetsp:Transcript_7071/g.14077  ORF Transcript_7071/g.14077 Transcript_7071/m.14077 type:complete len:255 (-) Transcript_7071:216-980(-)